MPSCVIVRMSVIRANTLNWLSQRLQGQRELGELVVMPLQQLLQGALQQNKHLGFFYRIKRICRKWCHQLLLGPPLPHALGARRT